MSAEPNNPIDERLKEYARNRRADRQVPAQLHPATRRLLQSEVLATYGQPAQGSPRSRVSSSIGWWFRWPGLAAIASLVLALAALVAWWPGTQTDRQYGFELAKLEADRSQDFFRNSAPSVASPPPNAPREDKAAGTTLRDESRISATSAASTPQRAEELARKQAVPIPPPAGGAGGAVQSSPRPAPISVPALSAASTVSSLATEPASTMNLQFAQIDSPAPARGFSATGIRRADTKSETQPTPAPLLQRFQLNSTNGQLQIVDQDGSTYEGSIVAQNKASELKLREAQRMKRSVAKDARALSDDSEVGELSGFSLNARGTNRLLRQMVVLQGELKPVTTTSTLATTANRPKSNDAIRQEEGLKSQTWEFRSTVSFGEASQRVVNAVQVFTNLPASSSRQTGRGGQ